MVDLRMLASVIEVFEDLKKLKAMDEHDNAFDLGLRIDPHKYFTALGLLMESESGELYKAGSLWNDLNDLKEKNNE